MKILFPIFITLLFCPALFGQHPAPKIFRNNYRKIKLPEKEVSLEVFNLRKLKPGMTIAVVERKLGKKLILKRESRRASKNFKTVILKARNNVLLRFYRKMLFGIGVNYPKKQWADINELTAALSKELKLKIPWKTLVISGDLEIRVIYLRKYQIEAMSNNIDHNVFIYKEKIMNRLRKQLQNGH